MKRFVWQDGSTFGHLQRIATVAEYAERRRYARWLDHLTVCAQCQGDRSGDGCAVAQRLKQYWDDARKAVRAEDERLAVVYRY